jgi:hypothetical protein
MSDEPLFHHRAASSGGDNAPFDREYKDRL